MADNIVPSAGTAFVWSKETPREQLNELYEVVVAKAKDSIGWYVRKKQWPSRMSRFFRALAIALIVIGGICPILQSTIPANGQAAAGVFGIAFNNWGYLLLALGAASVLADRFGGFSTAWMRYITTHLKLDGLLQRFQLEWHIASLEIDLSENPKDPVQLTALLEKLRTFAQESSALVNQETEAWVVEFQNQLAVLQKATEREKEKPAPQQQQQQQQQQPGADAAAADKKLPIAANPEKPATPAADPNIVNPTPEPAQEQPTD
ncbi:MAG TPA: SLATT domain-containing protein [Thermoanaerobaculia bacterium]|jgi:hypothetical protein